MALDQATRDFLTAMAEIAGADAVPIWEMTPTQARQAFTLDPAIYGAAPKMHRAEEVSIPLRDGAFIPARLLIPTEHPRAVFVYLHGGGFVLAGDLDIFDTLARRLAVRTGAAVLLVGYRLAPEFPFPIPLNDCWDALCWADTHKTEIAGKDVPLLIGGDSAGGNMSAVLSRWVRERNGPLLAAQILIYPSTDSDFTRPSYLDEDNQTPLLSTTLRQWYRRHYLPNPALGTHPDASPLLASDLSGQAPALILLAQHDILRDEGWAYADALKAADVQVECHEFPGQMHGFFTMTGILPASDLALERIGVFVEHTLAQAQ